VPDGHPSAGPEDKTTAVTDELVAGRPWLMVENVTHPTMTVYQPKGHHSGAAVVVFPGGGYKILAIDLEGTEVCDWLTSQGMTCVLLKYRVPDSGDHWDPKCKCQVKPKVFTALQDAQRTLGLVRLHAAEWGIDPHKVGVLGFSAGGHLAAAMSTNAKRTYQAVDAADQESCRPDFAVALYPGHLWDAPKFQLRSDTYVHVTREASPTFLLQAEDDPVDDVNNSLVYYMALKKAGVAVEMHLYPRGGHAFGLRRTELPITAWPHLVETWLSAIGMIPKQ
jgi:acetyl esterase/lipase